MEVVSGEYMLRAVGALGKGLIDISIYVVIVDSAYSMFNSTSDNFKFLSATKNQSVIRTLDIMRYHRYFSPQTNHDNVQNHEIYPILILVTIYFLDSTFVFANS